MGNLSDKCGRRPVLLLSLFGFGVDYIILALAYIRLVIYRSCDCRDYRLPALPLPPHISPTLVLKRTGRRILD